ncbi:hypothetical protein SKAU_G00014270 [Synaphobranchus kaupii]|uniref:C-C motif chemokine n=1 Tax=Synaphobranchus kaupii TaxID=118154 RepID=A0A9Q1GBV0_SYNKA|nr:hypothetical protein SKAU_G00014270 [Synaphobranchus kaupii]
MDSRVTVFCLGLLCLFCCSSLTQGELVLDCCLKVSNSRIPKNNVKSYAKQAKGHGCNIDAVVFTTKRNVNLCAPTEQGWVKALMTNVDRKLKWCAKRKFQPKLCVGLQA